MQHIITWDDLSKIICLKRFRLPLNSIEFRWTSLIVDTSMCSASSRWNYMLCCVETIVSSTSSRTNAPRQTSFSSNWPRPLDRHSLLRVNIATNLTYPRLFVLLMPTLCGNQSCPQHMLIMCCWVHCHNEHWCSCFTSSSICFAD